MAVAAGFWAWAVLAAAQAQAASQGTEDDIFESTNLLRISIVIPEQGMQQLRYSPSGFQPGRHLRGKPKAQARIVEGDRVYTNVTVQLKGNSSFEPIDRTPALTLNFDKFAPHQQFHGLTKISLNNSLQDPTFLHEKFSRELFAAAGVPVPRADHAVVTLNGRDLGFYVLVEGYNKQFLKRYFKRTDGNLYDGGILQDIDRPLEASSGQHPTDHSGLRRLIAATREPDVEKRFRALEGALDLDRFISMMAMEALLCHSDSYSMNRNNYRVYHDPGTDKLVFMPHGMDRVLGTHRSSLDLAVVPPMMGIAARAVVSTPEGRRRYLERAGVLFTNLFQPERLCRRVHEIDAKLAGEMVKRPVNRRFHMAFAQSHAQDADDLCSRISKRAENLEEQFAQAPESFEPAPTPNFGPGGMAQVNGWKPKLVNRQSRIPCETIAQDGKPVVHLMVPPGARSAALRSRVSLPAGSYQLVGEIKVTGPRGEGFRNPISAGVIRYSPHRFGAEMYSLNRDDINFGFEVLASREPEEIEFVCDIRSGPGDVWFDASSLRLIRRHN